MILHHVSPNDNPHWECLCLWNVHWGKMQCLVKIVIHIGLVCMLRNPPMEPRRPGKSSNKVLHCFVGLIICWVPHARRGPSPKPPPSFVCRYTNILIGFIHLPTHLMCLPIAFIPRPTCLWPTILLAPIHVVKHHLFLYICPIIWTGLLWFTRITQILVGHLGQGNRCAHCELYTWTRLHG